jgi:hypothetical protein
VCLSDQYNYPLHAGSTEAVSVGGTIWNALNWLLTAFGNTPIYSVLYIWLSLNLAEICSELCYWSYTVSNMCEKVIAICLPSTYMWQQHILVVSYVDSTQTSSKLKIRGGCNNFTTFNIKHRHSAFCPKEIRGEYLNLKKWRNRIKKYWRKQWLHFLLKVLWWQNQEGWKFAQMFNRKPERKHFETSASMGVWYWNEYLSSKSWYMERIPGAENRVQWWCLWNVIIKNP